MANRIKGITVEIGGDTTGLDKALKGVNSTIKTTQSSLKDVNKLLKLDPANTNLVTQKQKLLKDAISATKEKLDALKTAQEQAKQQLENGTLGQDKYDALQREIEETEQDLKSLQSQAMSAASVLGSQMQAVGGKIKEVGDKVTGVGKTVTEKLTLPLAAVGAVGVKSFAEVDKTMQLTNQTMGNSEEQAELLNKAMKEAASNSTFGMNDAAQAALNFARAGLSAEEASSALAPAMNLAAGEGGELNTVSEGLVATINGFHGSFSEAGQYADVFAAACNNSALDVNSLSSAMSTAAPVFSAAGYSVNDAALYMGIMANAGIGAEEAATSLKTGLARLVDPSKEGAEALKALGVSVTNADGTMKDSVTVQQELHDAFSTLSESEQIAAASAIFGKNQMDKWLALINTSPAEVGELDSALTNCSGTTEKMAEAMMSGFGGSLEKLKSSIDVLVTSIGEALAPTILQVTNVIQNLVDRFNSLTPAQQQTIVKIGLLVAAIGPLLMVIGTVISTIGTVVSAAGTVITFVSGLSAAFAAAGGAAGIFTAAMAVITGPIGIAAAAIAALIAIGVLLWKNWDKIKEFASQLGENLKKIWSNIQTSVSQIAKNTMSAVVNTWSNIKNSVSNLVTGTREKIVSAWNSAGAAISSAVSKIRSVISSGFTAARTLVSNVVSNIGSMISSGFSAAKNAVSNAVSGIQSKISSGFNSARNTVLNIFSKIQSGIKEKMTTAQKTVSDVISKIRSKFNFSWSLPKLKLPHVHISGHFSLRPPSVPHFSVDWYKEGGIMMKPTMFGINGSSIMAGGEAGAEAILPLKGFYDQLAGMLDERLNMAGMERYLAIIADNSSKGIYLEDGTLVGHLLPSIDSGLARYSMRGGRGNR